MYDSDALPLMNYPDDAKRFEKIKDLQCNL